MTANLLFLTNSDLLTATITASATASGYSASSLLTGDKSLHWKDEADASSAYIQATLDTATEFNAAIIGRADITANYNGVTWTYDAQYSDNGSDWTSWYTSDPLSVLTAGVDSASGEDYVAYTASSLGTHLYWRLLITPSADITAEIAKLYMGAALDLTADPVGIQTKRQQKQFTQYRPLYEFELDYAAVPYAQTMTLLTTVLESAEYHPIWMFTAANHHVLYNRRCYFVEIVDASIPQKITAQNEIRLVLREVM